MFCDIVAAVVAFLAFLTIVAAVPRRKWWEWADVLFGLVLGRR